MEELDEFGGRLLVAQLAERDNGSVASKGVLTVEEFDEFGRYLSVAQMAER